MGIKRFTCHINTLLMHKTIFTLRIGIENFKIVEILFSKNTINFSSKKNQ